MRVIGVESCAFSCFRIKTDLTGLNLAPQNCPVVMIRRGGTNTSTCQGKKQFGATPKSRSNVEACIFGPHFGENKEKSEIRRDRLIINR